MNNKKNIWTIGIAIFIFSLQGWGDFAFSQDEKQLIRDGNKQYKLKKFSESEKNYTKALEKKTDSYKGAFNLGDAYYKQGKFKEASEQFEILANRKTSKDTLAKVFHNLGNSYLQQKEFEKSVNAYKNALKNESKDEETRYNLAFAQRMLKQQQQQQKQQQQNQDKKNNKDKQKENQKDKNKKQNDKQQEKQQQQNISKEDAQRLLEALNNDEKNIRNKMNEKKVKVARAEIEKDW